MNNKIEMPGTSRVVRRLSALLLAGVVFGGACQGDNVFSGDISEYTPVVTDLSVPQVAFAGDNVTVRVDAVAARGVSRIVLALRGAVSKDSVVELDEPLARISEVISLQVPQALTDTVVTVHASVIDQVGNSSSTRQSSIVVFGPPSISNVLAPAIVQSGELMSLRVSAFGSRKISQLDIVATGAIQTDTSVNVFPARNSVVQDIVLRVPAPAQDTVIALTISAVDELGAASPGKSMLVPLVIAPPTVSAIVPPSVQAGKVLSVGVSASSARQIAEIRVEVRGGFSTDKVFKLSPTQANALVFVDVPLPENLLAPELQVRAIALDRADVLSATDVFTVDAPQGTPLVVSATPYWETITASHYADFRIQATGDRPITKLRVRWRGFTKDKPGGVNDLHENDNILPGPETIFTVDPPRLSVTEDIAVETPCVRNDAVFYALVTAYDADLNLSPIVMSTVFLTGDALCADPVDVAPVVVTTPRVDARGPGGILQSGSRK